MENVRRLLKGLVKTYVWTLVLTNAQWSTTQVLLFLTHLMSQEPPSYREGVNYKYQGILECDTILMKKIKEASHKEYLARLRAILNASVSAKNTITSIPTYTMPVLWYGFGVLHWTHT